MILNSFLLYYIYSILKIKSRIIFEEAESHPCESDPFLQLIDASDS